MLATVLPHPEHRLLDAKNRSATTNSLPYHEHLYSSIRRTAPKLWSARLRLRPRFAATLLPGRATVPRALRDIPRTLRSSITIRPWFLAGFVVRTCR